MRITTRTIALLAGLTLAVGCGKKDDKPVGKESGGGGSSSGGDVDLTGAGATFPYPLYSKWMHVYHEAHSNVRINYQSIGSGGGIRQITAGTVDFGASDAPMSDEELSKAPGKLVHIPTTLGAVVIVYNIDGVTGSIKLTPETIAGIYLGDIKKWNDPRLAADNPGVAFPDADITAVYRSDGSGTTAVFTDYLAKVSPDWKDKVGAGKSVKFPTGLGAKGNEGVSGQVKTSPDAIGYVELAYAKQTGLTYALIENADGKFVEPSTDGVSAAAAGALATMPADYRVSITNAAGASSYPISSFTYLLVYQDMKDATKAKTLAEFLWWAIHDGQELAPPLFYAQLPPEMVAKVEATLRGLQSGGQPVLAAR